MIEPSTRKTTRKSFAPVSINGTSIKPKNAIHRKKLEALQVYVRSLLASPLRPQIAKIILFGSVAKGEVRSDSDIDLMVIGFDQLDDLRDASYNAILEVAGTSNEGIEPLFERIDEWIEPQSYFTYRVTRFGKEVYTVPDEHIKQAEASDWLSLAKEYLASAEHSLSAEDWRAVADLAYNAAELCAKGLLLFKMDDLPGSHGGIIGKFGEYYTKEGPLSRELGKRLTRALEIRSWARYRPRINITREMAEENVTLSREMISHLETILKEKPSAP